MPASGATGAVGASSDLRPAEPPASELPPLLTPAHGVPIPAGAMTVTANPLPPPTPPAGATFLRVHTSGDGGPSALPTPAPFSFQESQSPSPAFGVTADVSYGDSVLTPAHGIPSISRPPSSPSSAPPSNPPRSISSPLASAPPAPTPPVAVPGSTTPSQHGLWIKAVQRFWRGLMRTVVAVRRDPNERSVHGQYVVQVHAVLAELLRHQAPLTLSLRRSKLYCGTEVIYADADEERGVLSLLYNQGLEQIFVRPNVSVDEVRNVVDILSTVSVVSAGDVAVRLWTANMPNVRIFIVDPFDPVAPMSRAVLAEHDQYRQLANYVADVSVVEEPKADALAAWAPPAPLPWIAALDAELNERRRELDTHDQMSLLMSRASILLLRALGAEAEPSAETPAWRLLTDLLRAVVARGQFAQAQYLLDRMDDYARRSASANVRTMVEGVRQWLGGQDMVRMVMTAVEQSHDPDELQDAAGYLVRLEGAADASLWAMTGQLRSELARQHLADVLVSAAERDPQDALRHLRDLHHGLIVDMVRRAEARRTPTADRVWWFGLGHREAAVRAPATKLLLRRDGPVTESLLLERLDDHDAEVRIAALEAIGARPRQSILNRVQSYFKPERLEKVGEKELGAAMVAFAQILGARAVPQLGQILVDASRMGLGQRAVAVQVAAAQVLGAVPDSSAVKALQQGLSGRNPKVRSTCQRALEGFYGQSLKADPVPDFDLCPRPAGLTPAPEISPPRSHENEGRQLARGIVGLPPSPKGSGSV
ncbi:MAG: hypothetical protein AAFV29_01350 [Myxococcota bacterium]